MHRYLPLIFYIRNHKIHFQTDPDDKNGNDIKCNHIINHNCDEHLSKENEEKKEVTNDGKKNRKRKRQTRGKARKQKPRKLLEPEMFLCQHLDRLASWMNILEPRVVEIRELCGNDSLDSPSQVRVQYSNQYVHNQCNNETKDVTLPELCNLSDYICEHLDRNNRFGFHQVTNGDSLYFLDAEHIEYFNEIFGITGIE